ncbi:hypothetical protein [Salinarimonas sp.]|uniref:hypothetical protein n=1 Tax=Salinarimonas sp. TaxID=2766526 RepID=UPI0032D94E56
MSGFWKQLTLGILVALSVSAIGYSFWHIYDRVNSEPITAEIRPRDGQTSIRPFFELAIKPALGAYCSEPAWVRYLGEKIMHAECQRIRFEPHDLIDMETRRDFKESAEPIEILELFIERHQDCLKLEILEDTYLILEADNSAIISIGGAEVCP